MSGGHVTEAKDRLASPDETAAAFGRWLSHQLWVRRMAQRELGRKAGISDSRISYIIGGTRSLRTREMELICGVLEVPVAQAMIQATDCRHKRLNICRLCGAAL